MKIYSIGQRELLAAFIGAAAGALVFFGWLFADFLSDVVEVEIREPDPEPEPEELEPSDPAKEPKAEPPRAIPLKKEVH